MAFERCEKHSDSGRDKEERTMHWLVPQKWIPRKSVWSCQNLLILLPDLSQLLIKDVLTVMVIFSILHYIDLDIFSRVE